MQTSYPLGHIDVRQPQPKYRGVSRSQKASEALIDAAYAVGDSDALLEAVFAHVRTLYRSAPYNDGRGPNETLASVVADEVYRSLPNYSGPAPLAPYNPKRAPLSHLVNLKARSKHLNLVRDANTKKRTITVLAQNLGAADERRDVLSHLSDQQESRRRGLYQPERDLALGNAYRWPLAANVVTSAVPARTGWHYNSLVDAQN